MTPYEKTVCYLFEKGKKKHEQGMYPEVQEHAEILNKAFNPDGNEVTAAMIQGLLIGWAEGFNTVREAEFDAAGYKAIDFDANDTMRRLAKCKVICKGSPEGDEVEELLEGLGYEENELNLRIALFAYALGQSKKSRRRTKG